MTNPTAPDGTPIAVRPALVSEIEAIPWRCWGEDGGLLRDLFVAQETIGIAAWEHDRCVGVLHTFRVELPASPEQLPDERLHYVLSADFKGLAWCHACFHVGRTLESYAEELTRVQDEPTIWDGTDQRYFSRGIGTALLRESIHWARYHGYEAVLGLGAPTGLFNFCVWKGMLPYTTYGRLGFEALTIAQPGDPPPDWLEGEAPSEVLLEARAALRRGRPPHTLNPRLMILRLPQRGDDARAP